jgi:LCP family protein required for cell wall assembly
MGNRRLRVLAVLLAALTAAVSAAAAFAYWEARSVVAELQAGPKREVVETARPELDVPPKLPAVEAQEDPRESQTILLLGSDRRPGEDGHRADTIVLARLEPERERLALLSVPRDLLVAIPGHGRDRVNMAYAYGGPALLIRTLRETLGVEIDHFAEIDFDGFTKVVAAMGGVYLPIDQRYFNENRGTPGTNYAEIDLRPGYQRLTGRQALAFVRYRHFDSDLFRSAREQLFLFESMRQALGTSGYDVPRVRRLLRAFAEATTSDIDGIGELWEIVDAVRATPLSRTLRFTLPVRDLELWGAAYVTAGEAEIRRAVRRWLGTESEGEAEGSSPGSGAAAVRLVPDPGEASRLLRNAGQWVPCAPTELPPVFRWEAARAYELEGQPAAALYATRGSGRSLLWMWMTWEDPPALRSPTRTVERGGRVYELTVDRGAVRQVAWRIGEWHVWITNTLRGEVPLRTLLALAESCR